MRRVGLLLLASLAWGFPYPGRENCTGGLFFAVVVGSPVRVLEAWIALKTDGGPIIYCVRRLTD